MVSPPLIQDLYSANSLLSALLYNRRQYSHNTVKPNKRVRSALLFGAYNLCFYI
ncbi:unnamed protein product [Staurois parvus]|uniref:Uncharacterized protein n=1 Tax=Staurois parvus TaxID=386267 RepID=A0ABN9DZD5_9NEOB|nr:unnamed protein product [Staurois parvus]